jgi:signal transduction histidine kinase
MKNYFEGSVWNEHKAVAVETAIPGLSLSDYEYKETRELVQLVHEAADQLRSKGEIAFSDFRIPGSRWRMDESYIFVLDPEGNMLVHPDPELEGRNQLSLKDINGKFIINGLLAAATGFPDKHEGWYHYEWPVPGGLGPRWKSSYVQLVKTPSGESYVVVSGMYNDRMERVFVVDAVTNAVREIEARGKGAFPLLRDPTGPYRAKNAYIFATDMNGIELVNPAFPNLEGRDLLDLKDTQGKYVNRELLKIIQTKGAGWSDYMWPKPGESVSSLKSAYVKKARFGDQEMMVGCGVYLAGAPVEIMRRDKMSAPELMTLVRQAAEVLREKGEDSYSEFRKKDSKWLRDDTYFFVFAMDGTRVFHGAEPDTEGQDDSSLRDISGRSIVRMIREAGLTPSGEGWVHYMYPEPGNIFPGWKSSFVKRVTYPSGKDYIVGCGIYDMQMDKAFVEDVVNRAALLIEERGKDAFPHLRDKIGPFYFMDTYVFVEDANGTELVNPAQPSLEGKNLMAFTDLHGKAVVRDEIAAAMKAGSAWVDSYWYKPGDNTPALKKTYVRKVVFHGQVYIVGSGIYGAGLPETRRPAEIHKLTWKTIKEEKLTEVLTRQTVFGERGTVGRFISKAGGSSLRHSHSNEEFVVVLSGALQYVFDDRELDLKAGDVLVIPPGVPHATVTLQKAEFITFFAPPREDWIRGNDHYLRRNGEHEF